MDGTHGLAVSDFFSLAFLVRRRHIATITSMLSRRLVIALAVALFALVLAAVPALANSPPCPTIKQRLYPQFKLCTNQASASPDLKLTLARPPTRALHTVREILQLYEHAMHGRVHCAGAHARAYAQEHQAQALQARQDGVHVRVRTHHGPQLKTCSLSLF